MKNLIQLFPIHHINYISFSNATCYLSYHWRLLREALFAIWGKITYQNHPIQRGCFAPVKHATAVKLVRIVFRFIQKSPKTGRMES